MGAQQAKDQGQIQGTLVVANAGSSGGTPPTGTVRWADVRDEIGFTLAALGAMAIIAYLIARRCRKRTRQYISASIAEELDKIHEKHRRDIERQ